jgi:hypothetical protein
MYCSDICLEVIEENQDKTQPGKAGAAAEIRIRYLLNKSQKSYHLNRLVRSIVV